MVKKANIRINEDHNKSFLENFMDHPPLNEKNLNDFFVENRGMSDEKKMEEIGRTYKIPGGKYKDAKSREL